MDQLYTINNFEDGATAREVNSPRTLEACLRTGIDPYELLPKSKKRFAKNKALTEEMVETKYNAYEVKRKGLIAIFSK